MYDREELIAAEIDLEKIIAAKATHDTTGHYTRPDLLHFEILLEDGLPFFTRDA